MAQIDVSDLFFDPDFVDRLQVITRYPAVGTDGQNFMKQSVLNSVGCVQPASGRDIAKLPEGMRVGNVYTFWFHGQIVASDACKYSSIIVFNGLRYQVQHVDDWSNFGQGYTSGVCIAEIPA